MLKLAAVSVIHSLTVLVWLTVFVSVRTPSIVPLFWYVINSVSIVSVTTRLVQLPNRFD